MADYNTGRTLRPRKTAAEKAQADYEAAVKTRDLAQKKRDKLAEGLQPAEEAFAAAQRRVDYLALNPDLPDHLRPAAEDTDDTMVIDDDVASLSAVDA